MTVREKIRANGQPFVDVVTIRHDQRPYQFHGHQGYQWVVARATSTEFGVTDWSITLTAYDGDSTIYADLTPDHDLDNDGIGDSDIDADDNWDDTLAAIIELTSSCVNYGGQNDKTPEEN